MRGVKNNYLIDNFKYFFEFIWFISTFASST